MATLGPLAHGPEKRKMPLVAQASEPCLEELGSTGPAWYCTTVKSRDNLGQQSDIQEQKWQLVTELRELAVHGGIFATINSAQVTNRRVESVVGRTI